MPSFWDNAESPHLSSVSVSIELCAPPSSSDDPPASPPPGCTHPPHPNGSAWGVGVRVAGRFRISEKKVGFSVDDDDEKKLANQHRHLSSRPKRSHETHWYLSRTHERPTSCPAPKGMISTRSPAGVVRERGPAAALTTAETPSPAAERLLLVAIVSFFPLFALRS